MNFKDFKIEVDTDWEELKDYLYTYFVLMFGLILMFTSVIYFLMHVGEPAL